MVRTVVGGSRDISPPILCEEAEDPKRQQQQKQTWLLSRKKKEGFLLDPQKASRVFLPMGEESGERE